MEGKSWVGATVGPGVAAAVVGTVGDSGVAAPEPGDPVAGAGRSVAGGAGVAGTEVGTWVGAGSPPPQAARNRERRIRVRTKVASGNPEMLTVERNMWDPLRLDGLGC